MSLSLGKLTISGSRIKILHHQGIQTCTNSTRACPTANMTH